MVLLWCHLKRAFDDIGHAFHHQIDRHTVLLNGGLEEFLGTKEQFRVMTDKCPRLTSHETVPEI
jgi:hypothetical protein